MNNMDLNFYNHGMNIAKNAYEEHKKVKEHIAKTYGEDAALQYQCGYVAGIDEIRNEIQKDIDSSELENRIQDAIEESKER